MPLTSPGPGREDARQQRATDSAPGDVATRLATIWRQVLGLDQVGWDENYFDLGGDSALAVELFARIEQEFGRKLPLAVLFEAPTVAGLAAVLEQTTPRRFPLLVAIQPAGTKRPFFLVHDGTGDVFGYRSLAFRLGTERPVYGFQLANLTAGEAAVLTVETLAARYVRELQLVQPKGPYYLGGYCGGGTVAYEMAQQLATYGERVALLALIDTFNWSCLPPRTRWERWRFEAERLEFLARNYLHLSAEARRHLRRDKAAELAVRLRRIPTRGLRQVWRADAAPMTAALVRYRAEPYPGRVLDVRPAWQHRRFRGEEAKWGGLALGGVETVLLPAHAGGLLPEPLVQHLAEALQKSLDQADASISAVPAATAFALPVAGAGSRHSVH